MKMVAMTKITPERIHENRIAGNDSIDTYVKFRKILDALLLDLRENKEGEE